MRSTGYIFDLDGTLVDSYPEIQIAFNNALSAVDCPHVGEEVLKPLIGTSMSHVIKTCFPAWDSALTNRFRKAFGSQYEDRCHLSLPYEGANELLAFLGDDYRIVTNKPREWSERLLSELQWPLDRLICPSEEMPRKPSPLMLREAVRQLLVLGRRDSFVSIGDSVVDQLAAERAGLQFLKVSWGAQKLHCNRAVESWRTFLRHIEIEDMEDDVLLGS